MFVSELCLWFSPCTLVYITNKTDRHDINDIFLKVALNANTPTTQKIYIKKNTQNCAGGWNQPTIRPERLHVTPRNVSFVIVKFQLFLFTTCHQIQSMSNTSSFWLLITFWYLQTFSFRLVHQWYTERVHYHSKTIFLYPGGHGRMYVSCIYNYKCNQCLSPLMLWVGISFRQGVLDINIMRRWLATGWCTRVSSTN